MWGFSSTSTTGGHTFDEGELTSRAEDLASRAVLKMEVGSPLCHVGRDYGAVQNLRRKGELFAKALTIGQKVFAFVFALFCLTLFAQKLMSSPTVAGEALKHLWTAGQLKQVIPVSSSSSCKDYTYPQCEDALHWYLSQGAKTRCEAFERVKAEGDVFRYPSDKGSMDYCEESEGVACCGCEGQCSKCPPVLHGCSTWPLDGSWVVAFGDGSQARYNFDAYGHVEVILPQSIVPKPWKRFTEVYIKQGDDLMPPSWMNLSTAMLTCAHAKACRGITFDANVRDPQNEGKHLIYIKTIAAMTQAPGTGWETHLQEQKTSRQSVAVSGAVVQQSPGQFKLHLHKSAPLLFPQGSHQIISIQENQLHVEHHVRKHRLLIGNGLKVHG